MPSAMRQPAALVKRDARIDKHLNQAQECWRKASVYLAEGDFRKAGAEGWGAVAQLTEALATLRSWDHDDDDAVRDAVCALAYELPEQDVTIIRGLRAAEHLHGKFYEVYKDHFTVSLALRDVQPLLGILWGLLPAEYTGGVSFEQWAVRSDTLAQAYPSQNRTDTDDQEEEIAMPPRMRRPELPDRRDARIYKHLNQAREYWRKAPGYLAEGDLCQAGEKGWGATAQLTKAMATWRSWDHYGHEAIRDAITALVTELPEQGQTIARGLGAAERLHGNFYEVYMTLELAEFAFVDVRPLLDILWGLLPAQYTGGVTFAQWCEEG